MENKEKKTVKKPTKQKVVDKNIVEKKIAVKMTKYNIEDKFIHISVGDITNPARDEDVNEIEAKIKEVIPDEVNCIIFVTHHGVKVSVLQKDSNIFLLKIKTVGNNE